jgi:hypothetical protein
MIPAMFMQPDADDEAELECEMASEIHHAA